MSHENNRVLSLLIVHHERLNSRMKTSKRHLQKNSKCYAWTDLRSAEKIKYFPTLFIGHFTRELLSRGDVTFGFTPSSVSQPSSSSSWFSSSVENNSSSKNDPPSPYSCVWTDTSLDSRCGEPSMKSANLSARQSTVIRPQNQIQIFTFFCIYFCSYWACFFNILKTELY